MAIEREGKGEGMQVELGLAKLVFEMWINQGQAGCFAPLLNTSTDADTHDRSIELLEILLGKVLHHPISHGWILTPQHL
jgi:hypothetical protein